MYFVNYKGCFGFIKPWTAVRNDLIYSQQFLTPSIVAGIERKLFPELLAKPYNLYKIKRHRLSYKQISKQQEQIQPRGWNIKNYQKQIFTRKKSIVVRGILIEPSLYLGFDNIQDAQIASRQHINLCRNEDILFPDTNIIETPEKNFDQQEEKFNGFELIFERNEQSFLVGYNRFNNAQAMFGWLKIVGNPVGFI